MNWSDKAWAGIESIYGSILQLAFIQELADGSLPREKFQFYMAQDSIYLEHFSRALALLGARVPDMQDALTYLRFAENAILVERVLHDSFFRDFEVRERGAMQPACHHYIHFLKATAALEPVELGVAATLPCFWIYQKVGDYIFAQHKTENNPYQRWIDTYSGDEFSIAVQTAIACTDKLAAGSSLGMQASMNEAFYAAACLELEFWQAAYEFRKWPA
ncbi:thiaminase II [Flavihumibacter sp. CACIAM 22H1]|uniref:thiaminase II n=1 Tax=Flavihumibacter sp. CACIAM 22H1 TaxID=1812911 RepID=UPI0007A82835|nr:thiaminase II [Flavihumibacter sp. CACIAM 22H1]KYP15347.1 MAG: thiaminase II [Flavihumibacter sp. CACIAM 22H1]